MIKNRNAAVTAGALAGLAGILCFIASLAAGSYNVFSFVPLQYPPFFELILAVLNIVFWFSFMDRFPKLVCVPVLFRIFMIGINMLGHKISMYRVIDRSTIENYLKTELVTLLSYIVILAMIYFCQKKESKIKMIFMIASFPVFVRILFYDINGLFFTLIDSPGNLVGNFCQNAPKLFSWLAELLMLLSLAIFVFNKSFSNAGDE